MTDQTILVVEDEETLAVGLEFALVQQGFAVVVKRDGVSAFEYLQNHCPDLVLLDRMLPGMSGIELLKFIRNKYLSLPVIMLTARSTELDKIVGLDHGADDYVTKPFSLGELQARIRARLRRVSERIPEPQNASVARKLRVGDRLVDLEKLEVTKAGERIAEISPRERQILELLLSRLGLPVSRKDFLNEVWGHDHFPTTRTVDQHMVKLRKKIEENPQSPRFLLTVFGVGYQLETATELL